MCPVYKFLNATVPFFNALLFVTNENNYCRKIESVILFNTKEREDIAMKLEDIRETVQKVATAITAALELETEIVDEKLMIIAGTGRYMKKIGEYEEDGQVDSDYIYAKCIRNVEEYINFNPSQDPWYDAKENELAEVCVPIKMNGMAIGLIGLIAFNVKQRELIMNKISSLNTFLRIMAELIASKLNSDMKTTHLENTISSLMLPVSDEASFTDFIGESDSIKQVKIRCMQVAQSDSTILITGESGTGKDLLARLIHKQSSRADKPFISINCAAIPESLLESELFGYAKGAFTGAEKAGKLGKFQIADKGTIFLDEIGDMPFHLQAKLLTCIQNKKIDPVGSVEPVDIDIRIIAATNKNLEEMIEQKRFREDLYFRLNVIPINIPPLRERPEDVDSLIANAIGNFGGKLGKDINGITDEAYKLLIEYPWPGNVRELENAIEYAVNMENSNKITVTSLPERIRKSDNRIALMVPGDNISGEPGNNSFGFKKGVTLKDCVRKLERSIIVACLDETGRSVEGKREAAGMLNISESTLYRKLRELNI